MVFTSMCTRCCVERITTAQMSYSEIIKTQNPSSCWIYVGISGTVSISLASALSMFKYSELQMSLFPLRWLMVWSSYNKSSAMLCSCHYYLAEKHCLGGNKVPQNATGHESLWKLCLSQLIAIRVWPNSSYRISVMPAITIRDGWSASKSPG